AHPGNLFTLLHRRGYRLKVEEEATDMCPYPECRRRFSAHYFLANDRLARFRTWLDSMKPGGPPTLYFKHILLPHVPWIFLPTGQRYTRNVLGPILGLNSSEISVFDPTLVRQSWQRHLLQTGATDKLIGELIDRLKETGLYQRAMVVVLADHGVSFRVGATDRRTIVPANARDIAPIPLFVKNPGQRRGRRSHGLARTYDVLPTIAARIGLRLPRGLDGRVASSRAVRRRGRITVLSRARIGRITMSRGRLIALKR
ncbi:MAG: sulfatase-like hydrolase/transferase, partial [Gammaproteobacteria bacterium]